MCAVHRREITAACADVSQFAVKRLGYSGAELGRYLGVTISCINRPAMSGELSEIAQAIADSWGNECTFCTRVPRVPAATPGNIKTS